MTQPRLPEIGLGAWLDRNVIDWACLEHAYGPAEDIPALLAAAAEGGDIAAVWEELWSRLWHQGTVYSASFAALPALTALAASAPAAPDVQPLALAAAILGATEVASIPPDQAEQYRPQRDVLRALAERNLPYAQHPTDFVYALKMLLELHEPPLLQDALEGLANGQLETECSACGEALYVALDGPEITTRPWPGDESEHDRPVRPADLGSLPDAVRAAYRLVAERDAGLASGLLHVLGRTECPSCGTQVRLGDAEPD